MSEHFVSDMVEALGVSYARSRVMVLAYVVTCGKQKHVTFEGLPLSFARRARHILSPLAYALLPMQMTRRKPLTTVRACLCSCLAMFLRLEQRSHIHLQPFFFRVGLCQIVSSGSVRDGIICAAFPSTVVGELLMPSEATTSQREGVLATCR